MANLGTSERPLRVAIVGSGPSGFYAAESLYKLDIKVKVDMFDRLPSPFGLVRYGVAPDHPKIKNVIKVYEKIAERPDFCFIGNVNVGETISVQEMKRFYDAIIFSTGAETDKKIGIEGEHLVGSYASTEFVGWYNGHPDFQDLTFDLSTEVAVVIGQGNVAMDVCRILLKTVDELKGTDITQNALDALATSKIKEVHCFGRRGPAQAAFTPIEIREFAELHDAYPVIAPEDLNLNEASQKEIDNPANTVHRKNFEILKELAKIQPNGRKRKFVLHFFKSPLEIQGKNRVQKIVFEKNQLTGEPGNQKVRGTGEKETFDCGLIFRSVGYQGVAIKGLPFRASLGTIPHQHGRIMDSEQIFTGLYVSGWIKRGASGIIGTNKMDSEETVKSLLEDLPTLIPCAEPSTDAVLDLLKAREVITVNFADWKKIDAAEIERGQKVGKPREKFVRVSGMLSVL
jgi:ferredoxin--NADP+ reductase